MQKTSGDSAHHQTFQYKTEYIIQMENRQRDL